MTSQNANLLWLRLHLCRGLGSTTFKNSLNTLGSPEQIFAADWEELEQLHWKRSSFNALHSPENFELAARELELARDLGVQILTLHSSKFPSNLKRSPYAPPLLYALGELKSSDEYAAGIVGTRMATPYGLEFTQSCVLTLVRNSATIVSGMAMGIDRCAHHSALEHGGRTLAVLGQGLNTLSSRTEKSWLKRILPTGAVLSQFPLNCPPDRTTFPQRNKIISGLSRIVGVMESSPKGGAMITARLCLEEGKDLAALPGPYHSPQSTGCNALIAQGAHCLCSPEDLSILLESQRSLFPPLRTHSKKQMPVKEVPIQRKVPEELKDTFAKISADRTPLDHLLQDSNQASLVRTQLMQLEMQGFILSLPGGYYQRR